MSKTFGEVRKEKGISGPPLLKGSDVPEKVKSIKVTVKELRDPGKDFKSPAILDFTKPVYEKEAIALNITNLRALARVCGYDDDDFDGLNFEELSGKAAGRTIAFDVVAVNNPQTKRMGRGLFIHE